MKKIIVLILCALCTMTVWGQSTKDVSLPELMTPSPKATMMNRFGNYPTNLYTGLVDITIPVYTIKVGDFELPIEFKYHASGLKYDDLPMEVGYGWTLIAGGTVSYSARGMKNDMSGSVRDEPFVKEVSKIGKYYSTQSPPSTESGDQVDLIEVMNGKKVYSWELIDGWKRDSEYDQYTFSFPGHSGRSYVMQSSPRKEYDPFSTPMSTTSFNGNFYAPTAHDELGNHYVFGHREWDYIDRNYTFYLQEITVAGGKGGIKFEYDIVNYGSTDKLVQRPIITTAFIAEEIKEYIHYTTSTKTSINDNYIHMTTKGFNTPILKKISWTDGSIDFIYSTTAIRSLMEIRISEGGSPTKRVFLEKTDEAYLDAVHFVAHNGKAYNQPDPPVYSYKLEYNGKKPEGNHVAIDYWGYYNGRSVSTGTTYIPNIITSEYYTSINGMDRTPNESYMQNGILTKITYPTKGYSLFTYEAHRDVQNRIYGGLRIKEIKNCDATGKLLEKKWYEYVSGRPILTLYSNPTFIDYYKTRTMDVRGDFNYPYSVAEISTYGAFPNRDYMLQGSSVVYPYVNEYTGTSGEPETSTFYEFTDFYDTPYPQTMRGYVADRPLYTNEWKCGKLVSKKITNRDHEITYWIENEYAEINRKDHLNLCVSPYASFNGGTPDRLDSNDDFFMGKINGTFFDYYNYYLTEGEYKAVKSKEYINGVNGAKPKFTYYKYNALGQVIEEKVSDSDAGELTTRHKYAYDLEVETNPSIYPGKHSSYLHYPARETSVYKNETLIDRINREYKDWGGFLALQYVKQLNYYDPRIKYLSYDAYGNPTGVSKDDLEQTYYLWGYQGTRLLAEMKGAPFTQMLSKDLIDRVTSAATPATADLQAIEAVRTNATTPPNARITTLGYDTYRRLTRVTAPTGEKSTYEYDTFGRLLRIKDHNGMIVEQYQYDYKQ